MANVSAIKLPDNTTYNIIDKTSGYTKNTGTITKVQTTAGAHTTINVSSGAATFNVPTKTSHLTNDSGFITTSAATPTSNTVSKFDSAAHMNSTDMTASEVEAFVNSLDVHGDTMAEILETLSELSYTNSENAYLDYCKVKRVGNVVNIWGESTGGFNIPAGSYTALTTLPTWARPSHEVVDTVEAYGSASTEISIQIRTDGIVNLYATTTSNWWRYNVTYLL